MTILKAIDEVAGFKKYHTQMTSAEKQVLRVLTNGNFNFTNYSLGRMKERSISIEEVKRTIKEGNIIEYHLVNGNESRVLLRGKIPFRNYVTCVVVDLKDGVVVTVYKNFYLNNHPNADLSVYDPTLNIVKNVKNSFNSGKTNAYKYSERTN